jgi:hypothetical protein
MLVGYFKLSNEDTVGSDGKRARALLYEQIPDHFTWVKSQKKWKIREGGIPGASRMSYASPKEGERFYL